jgi:hypothetical protein
MRQRIPYFGAAGLHWPKQFGRGWFINLYIWRCGPLRLNWYVGRIGAHGSVEIPIQRLPLLHHWLHYAVLCVAGLRGQA